MISMISQSVNFQAEHYLYDRYQVILSNSILIGMKQYIGFYYLILFSAQAILGERLVRV